MLPVELTTRSQIELSAAILAYKAGLALSEERCAAGNPSACLDASRQYADGYGIDDHGGKPGDWGGMGYSALWPWPEKAQDYWKRGISLYEQGCAAGDAAQCAELKLHQPAP